MSPPSIPAPDDQDKPFLFIDPNVLFSRFRVVTAGDAPAAPQRRPQRTSRVSRHTVKRQLESSLTLPQIRKHGFTHPAHGSFLMLPREYDVVAALESKALAVVVLAILRRTIGVPGQGPRDRGEWVKLSIHGLADAALLPFSQAQTGLKEALEKGYLHRRKAGRSWEYAVRWRGMQN